MCVCVCACARALENLNTDYEHPRLSDPPMRLGWETTNTFKPHRLFLACFSVPALDLIQFYFLSCAPPAVECCRKYWDSNSITKKKNKTWAYMHHGIIMFTFLWTVEPAVYKPQLAPQKHASIQNPNCPQPTLNRYLWSGLTIRPSREAATNWVCWEAILWPTHYRP